MHFKILNLNVWSSEWLLCLPDKTRGVNYEVTIRPSLFIVHLRRDELNDRLTLLVSFKCVNAKEQIIYFWVRESLGNIWVAWNLNFSFDYLQFQEISWRDVLWSLKKNSVFWEVPSAQSSLGLQNQVIAKTDHTLLRTGFGNNVSSDVQKVPWFILVFLTSSFRRENLEDVSFFKWCPFLSWMDFLCVCVYM